MIRYVSIRKTSIVTHLKLDVDADKSLYQPPSMEKYQHLVNETYDYITTTSKTIGKPSTTTTIQTISKTT